MQVLSWADADIRACLAAMRQSKPFVYGLTNYVAANLSANVLLAVGASPAIGAAPGWPTAFAAGAGALWINTAALMSSSADTMIQAARAAHQAGTPWVLDPVAVGAGAPPYDAIIHELLAFHPTVIRGNASELIALAGGGAGGKGVDTTAGSNDAIDFIKALAARTGSIVAVSGAVDYVTDGHDIRAIGGGDVRLTQVTGAGCALGALIAAMLAANAQSHMNATCAAHAVYAVAAERASGARGTASFGGAFVDELSLLDAEKESLLF